MTTQELIDLLMKVPSLQRETREVLISTNNFHLETVNTVHLDARGDVIINAEGLVAQNIRRLE